MLRRTIACLFLLFPLMAHSAIGPLEQLGKQIDQTAAYMVVMAKLAQDPLLNPFELHVSIENGTATIEGVVDTDIQYDHAVEILQRIPGIEKVNAKNLKIKDSSQPFKDAWITTKIKAKLFKDKYFSHEDVVPSLTVSTKNGIVYAVGHAATLDQKLHTVNIIKSVEGVHELRTDIVVADVNTHE